MVQLIMVLLFALTAGAMNGPALAAEGPVCVENATIDDLRAALAASRTSAADLVRAYTARIEVYDRAGPRLNAIREMNPDGLAIAEALDARKSGKRRPLEGIPVLVKDNIATGDAQHTLRGARRDGGDAATRCWRDHPRQDEPHRVRQHSRDRHLCP
jgi:Amidase